MKRSFTIYQEYGQHLSILSDEERGKLLMALFDYADGRGVPELNGAMRMAFSFITEQIDKDNTKSVRVVKKPTTKLTTDQFHEFWELYPRHIGKVRALETWGKIDADVHPFDTIMSGLRVHVETEWRDTDMKMIPHASTWLHQARWVGAESNPNRPKQSGSNIPDADEYMKKWGYE